MQNKIDIYCENPSYNYLDPSIINCNGGENKSACNEITTAEETFTAGPSLSVVMKPTVITFTTDS